MMAGVGSTRVTDCPVCLGTFIDPRFLPCGHTFCLDCITKHGRSKDSDPDCPNCRTKFQIPSSGFDGLPKNYSLNSVLYEGADIVSVSRAKVTKGSCKKHSGQDLVLYCVQCSAVICLHCMDEDHQKHNFCRISKFAEEARSQLEGYIKSIKPILFQVTSQKTQIQEKSKKFCDLLNVTELAINKEYETKKRILDDHKRLLLEELSNEKQKVTKEFKMKTDEVETEHLRLASFNARIEEMLQGTDEATTFDIVCQHKDFKDDFEKLKQTQTQTLGQVNVKGIEFIPGDFKDLMSSRVNIIGRLQMESHSRQQTRADDNLGQAQASATDRVEPMKFTTHCGLTVYVSQGNLIYQSLDAIVNPANEYLENGGGAARAIAKAAGESFQRECKDFIRNNGKLGIACVTHTSAGNLRPNIRYVIHTVGPTKSDTEDELELFDLVRLTVLNCLMYANDELKINSIAIPAISSGIFGVPIEIVGRASYEALKQFDNYYADCKKKNLHEIHFLNNDEATFSNMKRIFQSLVKDNRENSVDPERLFNAAELLDKYANVLGRQSIDTAPHDDCFTRAFATALQKDFQSKLDWPKCTELIRRELDNNKDHYNIFHSNDEQRRRWSWTDVFKNPMDVVDAAIDNIFGPMYGDKGVDPDVWISAAANALNVQIVLVQLSEEQEPLERNFKPRLSENDDTVYIAYHNSGHYHFDALVKRSSLEKIVFENNVSKSVEVAPAEKMNKSPALNYSHNMSNGQSFESRNDETFEKMDWTEAEDMPYENMSGMAGKKKENASDMTGKNATKPGGDKKDNKKDDDDDNHCVICLDDITDKKELSCKHKFCRECIDEYFSKGQPQCPVCGKVFGTLRGDQPKGTMTTRETSYRLNGYTDCGTIEIDYSFNDGIQGANHPNPGAPYRGTHRMAYLPANSEGREVLRLLKRAFDAGLVFTIGRCNTASRDNAIIWNAIIWNDVSHKTSTTGQHGYPDPTYLKRVTEELAAKGIR